MRERRAFARPRGPGRDRAGRSNLAIAASLGLGSLAAACLPGGPSDACPGDCLCFSTPEDCPVGCYPTYDILPDGGGTGQFFCSNVPEIDLDAQAPADAEGGETLPACPTADASTSGVAAELPSGACSGAASCSAEIEVPDCSGAVDGWTCSCTAGQWACRLTSANASACVSDAAEQ